MTRDRKIAIGICAVALVGAVIVSGFESDGDSSSEPAEGGPFVLLADKSLCLADAGTAKIHFRITVRNDGAAGSVNAVPWRRYSDNEVNDSGQDEISMEVPAGETVTFRGEFGYNAEEHRLLECGVKFDGAEEPTQFAVVG